MESDKVIILKGAGAVLGHNGVAPKYRDDMFDTEVAEERRIRGLSRRFPQEHRSYTNMTARCKKNHQPVHPAFRSFAAFMKVLGPKPSAESSLDRIDNDKGYSPDNVRWASKRAQANNRSSTRFMTLGDRRLPLTEWARIYRTNPETIRMRLERGWSDEEAIIGERFPLRVQSTVPVKSDSYIDGIAIRGRSVGVFPKSEPLYFSCVRAAIHVIETSQGVAEQHGWELPDAWQAKVDQALFVMSELLPALKRRGDGKDLVVAASRFGVF